MTEITDAGTTMDAAIRRVVTSEQRLRIADAFASEDPYRVKQYVIPNAPTNEEKAAVFNQSMKAFIKVIVRAAAEKEEKEGPAQDLINAAGDLAQLDVD